MFNWGEHEIIFLAYMYCGCHATLNTLHLSISGFWLGWGVGGRKTLQEQGGSGSDTDLAHFTAMLPTHCYYKTYYGTVPPIDFLTCSRWQRSGNVGGARQRSLCRRSALALATVAWSCLRILSAVLVTRTKVLY